MYLLCAQLAARPNQRDPHSIHEDCGHCGCHVSSQPRHYCVCRRRNCCARCGCCERGRTGAWHALRAARVLRSGPCEQPPCAQGTAPHCRIGAGESASNLHSMPDRLDTWAPDWRGARRPGWSHGRLVPSCGPGPGAREMCQMYVRGALSARQTGHLSLLDNPVTASAQWGRVGGDGGPARGVRAVYRKSRLATQKGGTKL